MYYNWDSIKKIEYIVCWEILNRIRENVGKIIMMYKNIIAIKQRMIFWHYDDVYKRLINNEANMYCGLHVHVLKHKSR